MLCSNLHGDVEEVVDGDVLRLSVGGCARGDGGLRDLHCWSGSLWAIWLRVLQSRLHQVQPHAFGIRSIPLDLKPESRKFLLKFVYYNFVGVLGYKCPH